MADKVIAEKTDVTQGGAGFFAVHRVLVKDDKLGEYWDVQQTGIGRYSTRAEAEDEARHWSESDGIPLAQSLLDKKPS